jgi:hypothetical protein
LQILVAGACVLALALLGTGCRTCGINWLLLPAQRARNELKNRTALPTVADFDRSATLEALLQPGNDRQRWSNNRAAAIEGFVVRAIEAGRETANCLSATRRDLHIELAQGPDASPRERVIVEVTPRLRDQALKRGLDWSTPALQRALVGRRVRIEGWLFFDDEHDDEAENTRPGRAGNWRATAWEVHPVTAIVVLEP